jgi:hypothetical protein
MIVSVAFFWAPSTMLGLESAIEAASFSLTEVRRGEPDRCENLARIL